MEKVVNDVVEFLSKGDFLFILLIVLIIIIVVFIIYLIKLELSGRIDKEEIKIEKEEKLIEETPFETKQEDLKIDPIFNVESDPVLSYENEQEETAIISAEELDNRTNNMSEEDLSMHEKEIARYEEEQEDKAIISYDELIKRAGVGMINYESEKDLGGVRVSKVDFNQAKEIEFSKSSYYQEERFLESLKEFRRNL